MIAFATMAQRTTSTIARLLMLGLVASCYGGDPLDQTVEDINVCHTTVVEGIDVSEFQGNIDWNAVHASGRQFAITRLGDGTYHVEITVLVVAPGALDEPAPTIGETP